MFELPLLPKIEHNYRLRDFRILKISALRILNLTNIDINTQVPAGKQT